MQSESLLVQKCCVLSVVIYDQLGEGLATDTPSYFEEISNGKGQQEPSSEILCEAYSCRDEGEYGSRDGCCNRKGRGKKDRSCRVSGYMVL